MIEEKTEEAMNLQALRAAREGRDSEVLIGFYADDAELRVVNADTPDGPTFKLRGRAEIERYLRVIFEQETSSSVEEEVSSEKQVTFREVCDYLDGTRVVVRTTLELGAEGILSQVDMVEYSPDHGKENS